MSNEQEDYLEQLQWPANGLLPAIAQDYRSGRVLMLAWMNLESLKLSIAEGRAVYWSRSREQLWRKGEQSGHVQKLHEIRVDCDFDAILLKVEQLGGISCHTGRESCFYYRYEDNTWLAADAALKNPADIYSQKTVETEDE